MKIGRDGDFMNAEPSCKPIPYRSLLLVLWFAVTCNQPVTAQGVQFIGPDSSNWRGVYRISARFNSSSDYSLAAMTENGIATYNSTEQEWRYIHYLPPPDPYCFPGNTGFYPLDLEFSPWESDGVFLGSDNGCIEPNLTYQKMEWPSGDGEPPPGDAVGFCMSSGMSLIIPPQSDSIAYASICGLYRSSNRGDTWTVIDSSGIFNSGVLIATDYFNPDIVYKVDYVQTTTGLLRSSDAGGSWETILDSIPAPEYGSPHYRPNSLIALGDTLLLGVSRYPSDTTTMRGIFRSMDGGLAWQQVLQQEDVVGLKVRSPQTGEMFAASGTRIYSSPDHGSTWSIFIDSLSDEEITSFVLDPFSDTMYVSTKTGGVLKLWNPGVGVSVQENIREYRLHQNHPNPFNPSTEISFSVPGSDEVSLKIFDVLGREVATLIDGRVGAGTHTVRWASEGCPGGIYFYRIHSGNFMDTKKMVLVK